ncbi:SDR family NAD(P)-dependent oxidoreductase [Kribbella antibiotica]|uniref:SDR family NAD(P)-dependent oxidoreductase n=1 Tax=Kribbella antibiotica TaxID=190195 RepID=A0A4R4ZTY2_9ACTN|nr:SDR family NAD(P)-dependent oxidoreductase [Kribbella antibiotica]TDD61604.1 SDR family NAD(P)-dependent oxidoreductase [Kribbella antibiotica]
MELTGRRIWIVGASSGIGAALAGALDARGAHVAVSARRESALRDLAGDRMAVVPVDITDGPAVRRAAAQVVDELGGLDIVVLSAGYWKQLKEFDAESFQQHLDVNLSGMAHCIEAVIPLLEGAGMIVGISSVAGLRGLPGSEAYGATKAAQINLLEALRVGLAPRGIDVLTVLPGFVDTEMTSDNQFPMPFMVTAPAAARMIADGIERRQARIVFPWQMGIFAKLAPLVPDRLWARLFKPKP